MASEFSRLPFEVLLLILHSAPDLPSLYNLICASARVNAAFEFDAAHILDKAINRSIPEFKHLARMISILGSLNIKTGLDVQSDSSSPMNFDLLVRKFASLPKDVLTTASPSCVFATGTPGPRYLLLTAYRIEHLRHICFVTLLQNIHELLFLDDGPNPDRKEFRPGVFFDPAAWWSPSWAERFRIEQALWKLFIYWNIRAIDDELDPDENTFHQYSAKIKCISPNIGPETKSVPHVHVAREMACISAAVREFLGCAPFTFFTAFTNRERNAWVKEAMSRHSLVLKATGNWKFESPKPSESVQATQWGQTTSGASRANSIHWQYYSANWEWCVRMSGFKFEQNGPWFADYLGVCLWDRQRLVYLGLQDESTMFFEPGSRLPKKPGFYTSNEIPVRWQDVFLEELARLPGGQRRWLFKYEEQIIRWYYEIVNSGGLYGLKPLELDQCEKDVEQLLTAHAYRMTAHGVGLSIPIVNNSE